MDEKDFERLIISVSAVENVTSAYICSRAGSYLAGTTPRMADRNMYSAITSLAFGTAEQVGNEMNDNLQHVSLNFTEKRLLIISLGSRHLMGILADKDANVDELLFKVRALITA